MTAVCSQCGVKESDSVEIHEIIMPPELPTRTTVCKTCLDIILDNERNKKEDIQ